MNLIFYLIIIILLVDFCVERLFSWLNIKNMKLTLPEKLKDVYSEEKYALQQEYSRTNQRFGLITSSFSFVLMFGMFILGGFGWLDANVRTWLESPILISLVFFGILYIANDLLSTPFEVYDIFAIEERFGFNKMTPKIFVMDKLKSYLITVVISGALLSLVMYIYQLLPQYFWLLAWALVSVFSLFMMMFYSNLIVPLFNKQSPLEEGELRNEIEDFCKKADFQLKNVFVIDGSKRSTKGNAYFTGLGAKKRIVLYDTLIQDLSKEEIVAVLAHEIGHYKKKHTTISLILSLANTGVMFYILSLFLGNLSLSQAFGSNEPSFHLSVLAFAILYSPISVLLGVGMNVVSRRNEYQADAFAAHFGLAEHLISGLKKLSSKSLSNLQPHPAYVFMYYSHPTLLQRMEKIANK
jgi:STE24 endopeptidase